jgi:hypothetical protein
MTTGISIRKAVERLSFVPDPGQPYPPNEVQPVYDGVNASKKSPEQCQAWLNDWRDKFPEKENPDYRADGTGIIQPEWKPPEYEKTTDRAAVLAEKLKVLLDFRNQDAIEPLQTNIFVGDNDNYIHEEDDPKKVKRDVESEMPMRPSENEMSALVKGVHFEKRCVRWPDSYDMDYRLVPKRGFTVGPDGKLVPNGGDVEWADNGAIKRMGGLRFNTADKDLVDKFSKHLGEKTQYLSGGKWRPVNNGEYEITGAAPVTVLNALFDKQLGAVPSNINAKPNGLVRSRLRQSALDRWNKLFKRKHGTDFGIDKCGAVQDWASKNYDLRSLQLDTLPRLPPSSMSENEALVFCGLSPKPANENRIRFGLPYDVKSASRLSMSADGLRGNASTGQAAKAQTSEAMLTDSPEDILLLREEMEHFARSKSELTPDDLNVVESFFSSAHFVQVGRETGDEGKHERTQEKNGQRRVLQVAAKYEAIRDRIAA